MGKLIVMSSNSQITGNTEATLTPNNIRDLAATIDIFRSLGGIVALEATTKSHTEKIEQLTQWVSAIPSIEKDVGQNTKDLNELGRRHTKELNDLGIRLSKEISDLRNNEVGGLKNIAHTAKTLGIIALSVITPVAAAIIYAVLHFGYQAFERLLSLPAASFK
jgi:hypothetical protein